MFENCSKRWKYPRNREVRENAKGEYSTQIVFETEDGKREGRSHPQPHQEDHWKQSWASTGLHEGGCPIGHQYGKDEQVAAKINRITQLTVKAADVPNADSSSQPPPVPGIQCAAEKWTVPAHQPLNSPRTTLNYLTFGCSGQGVGVRLCETSRKTGTPTCPAKLN